MITAGKPVKLFGIVDTGWSEEDLFVVVLSSASLTKEEAGEYARVVAARRRCGIPVSVGMIKPATGNTGYQRAFFFKDSVKKNDVGI